METFIIYAVDSISLFSFKLKYSFDLVAGVGRAPSQKLKLNFQSEFARTYHRTIISISAANPKRNILRQMIWCAKPKLKWNKIK